MTASADQVLRDHGLTRENAKQFVLLSPAFNRKALADEMEISEDTAHRYRRAFREMDVADRARVVAALAAERQVRDEGVIASVGVKPPTDAYSDYYRICDSDTKIWSTRQYGTIRFTIAKRGAMVSSRAVDDGIFDLPGA